MSCHCATRSTSLFFLLIFSTFFFFFFLFSNALQDVQVFPLHDEFNGYERYGGEVMKWENHIHRRSIAEAENGNSSLILAAQRTYRRDPIDDFKRYTGGWNISNTHYWASVAFTAAPFFVVAAVWFLIFGLTLVCTCLYFCCCRRAPYGYSRVCYALSLIFLILFTISAIIGCIFLYTGQGKFHASTTRTLHYVVSQADLTVDNLNKISQYLDEAKNIGIEQVRLPETIQNKIIDVQKKIDSAATTLSVKTQDNSKNIRTVLDSVRLALVILAAVMLLLAFVGFLLSIFGIQSLVYTLIILGWLLVTLTYVLCGIFLLLHKFPWTVEPSLPPSAIEFTSFSSVQILSRVVADTCVAMDQWVQNPTAHTALDDILPCVDNQTAQETLQRSKEVTSQLVSMVDMVIGNIANANPPPNTPPPFYYNQSGPAMPNLCNPFNSDLSNRTCAAGEVDFNNATEVWKNYVCQSKMVQRNEICATTGRLTPTLYSQMNSTVNVAYGLYHYAPFLVELQDCTFVRRTFDDISTGYCPGLRRYTAWIYIGLLMVSAAVMCSLIFWVVYARERRHRVYTKELLANGGH